ncbi:MAG: class I SAM-dependent methyltransferase [Bdellovibrionota bacterium]
MSDSSHSTTRFSNRVEDYVKYRPHYPKQVVQFLEDQNILSKREIVADIGSGTGISARLFLDHGYRVYGVEPNAAMRNAGEVYLSGQEQFVSIDGTSESTTLGDHCVHGIVVAQAFHWFDVDQSRKEFQRILKPNRHVILMWNNRSETDTSFLKAYEQMLLDFGTDYTQVKHQNCAQPDVFRHFFGHDDYLTCSVPHTQHLDFVSLKGRLDSSSYVPQKGQNRYDEMINTLRNLFDKHQENQKISMIYHTQLYVGTLV